MIWRGSNSLPIDSDIFTQTFYHHYSAPPSFNFEDPTSKNNPNIINTSIYDNHKERVESFVSYVQEMSSHYRTNHILVPFGDDFTYKPFSTWFYNIDQVK
jgi:lysosomal alpha-mannosidase